MSFIVFYMDFEVYSNFGIINENEKLKNPGAQCWAALWPMILACWPSPVGDTAHGAVAARACRARSQRGHRARGGALVGGPVVLDWRRGLVGEHQGFSREPPTKVRRSGAHRSSGAMARRLAAATG
jgi:hypothetical protein